MLIFYLFCFPLFVKSKVAPPEIPKRPSLEELKKSLNDSLVTKNQTGKKNTDFNQRKNKEKKK